MMNESVSFKRNNKIDAIKSILIILVVIAHSRDRGILHDFIFLFHMPLFFVISGYFCKKKAKLDGAYIKKICTRYLIPYLAYMVLILLVLDRNFKFSHFIRLVYGGRALGSTYWYMTCLVFALFLFTLIRSKFSETSAKCLILVGGGLAVLESHLTEYVDLLESPGIPWNLDVSLMAMLYIGIGFYCKNKIKVILEGEEKKYDLIAAVIIVALIIFCIFNYSSGEAWYYFDMKPIYYKELVSAVVVPCLFGFVICRITHWLEKVKVVENVFAFFGRMTIPIMFLHVPLNQWMEDIGYGRIVYVLIGIVVPVIFTAVFCRFERMRKLFGLPDLYGKRLSRDEKSEMSRPAKNKNSMSR